MGSVLEEKMRNIGGGMLAPSSILEDMKLLKELRDQSGSRKVISSELWHACAGPLVCLPQVGSLAYYFPQGHSEQLAVSTKGMATSQIPNYPNLPAQLLCQIQNVTLHADKETDEIFTQMCLKPVNSEKDVFPVPDFGLKPSKHPNDFFCKILTASDTSTHGGFSVPRRAAEKLFPPLDFTMQPPTQELVVRDLHDNSWTFRHIYRGQPKRHLLTTGWSLFVGTKRLKAGDSVLFIRDEKSQLLVGVRRANRQQTTVTSVLSADSMHIGVLAAAAHAAANQSPFTIFYNPRACPSEFVIPLAKFQKALYGTQFSVGMRFGMMFETEESSKRRYMGTIIGISDFDPLRWPGSKWRSLQVEWDEPGCCDKQNRVSIWEVETPESLFIFPSMTSSFKRPFPSGFLGAENEWKNMIKRPFIRVPEIGNMNSLAYPMSNLSSEQLVNMLLKPQFGGPAGTLSALQQALTANGGDTLEELKAVQAKSNQKTLPLCSEGMSLQNQNPSRLNMTPKCSCQTPVGINTDKAKLDPDLLTGQVSQLSSAVQSNEEKFSAGTASSPYNHAAAFVNQNQGPAHVQTSSRPMHQASESLLYHPQQIDVPHSDFSGTNGSFPSLDNDECMFYQSLAGTMRSPGPISVFGLQDSPSVLTEINNFSLTSMGQEMWDNGLSNFKLLPHVNVDQLTSSHQDPSTLNYIPNSSSLRDLSDESNNQSGIYGCASLDVGTGVSNVVDPSVSSTIMDEISTVKHADFQNHSHCNLVGNFSSSQDLQSQITSASLGDSQAFSRQELQDNSGGTSSSNIDLDENSLLQNSSWHPVVPPLRTYTKVQKTGSVGRSIDVTSYTNYEELCSAIECMFGLQGLLNDPRGSGWKLVYVDYENDVLLVGDDPWEEFVGCVRCIRILSPTEVQQMSEEGMKLLNSAAAMQGMNNSSVS